MRLGHRRHRRRLGGLESLDVRLHDRDEAARCRPRAAPRRCLRSVRRPRIVRAVGGHESVTGRLMGSMARVGSSSDRCSAAGVRSAPMSLRSGAVRGPSLPTRWQVRARALAGEERLAALDVADLDRRAARVEAGPDERDDARDLGRRRTRSSACAGGTPLAITCRQVVVGDGAAEAPEAQVHAGHRVAVGAVTELTLGAVEAQARGDVGRGIGVVLGRRERPRVHEQERRRADDGLRRRCACGAC